ncbi:MULTISPECIES: hypothetical protein [Photorhabdus]|uniref:Uncharacterized protein n=1 Tax=Photorhabdus kayaii TaxID=230088 RepID=A0ABX0AZS7_9GAMM|nr:MULTISPECIES: hypothetical protein [Photorhabdus]MCC8374087.1 hypothetical protein [Photorhabdus bodei]MCT8352884.1 hypothetical protein [Photorhabdus kayaii]MDB6368996.1 hypothetical protein [Photorhabdus bodei]NDL12544.1 hypothetical protein [Photorhabdus kayaii]NDL26085.1 hypothetical protein [Photorhabdus kayaii]
MQDFIKGAHAEPFSFVHSVESISKDEVTARSHFSTESTYRECCQNSWHLIVESLAQAAGIHIKNQLDINYNGYLVGVDDLNIENANVLMEDYFLVARMISNIDNKYLYHCEAMGDMHRPILTCRILLSNSN